MPMLYPLKSVWKLIIKILLESSIFLVPILLVTVPVNFFLKGFKGIGDSFTFLFYIIFGILLFNFYKINKLYEKYKERYYKKSLIETDLRYLIKFSSKSPWGFKFLREDLYKLKESKLGSFIFNKIMKCGDLETLKHNLNEIDLLNYSQELKKHIECIREIKNIFENLISNPSDLIDNSYVSKKDKLMLINELIECSEIFNEKNIYNILFYFQDLKNRIILSSNIYEISSYFDNFFKKIEKINEEFESAYLDVSSYLEKN